MNEFYKAEQDYCKISSENHPKYAEFIKKYDDEFFKNNVLVLFYDVEPSGSNRIEINDVTKDDGTLKIWSTTKVPFRGTGDLACRRIFIEVDKASISNVTKVVVDNIKVDDWK